MSLGGCAPLSVLLLLSTWGSSISQYNTVTLDNKSGEPVSVRLIGPTAVQVDVPTASQRTVSVAPGQYHLKVRYGEPGKHRYACGEEFRVNETATVRSQTTIALQGISDGAYRTRPISQEEFGADGEKGAQADTWRRIILDGKVFTREHQDQFWKDANLIYVFEKEKLDCADRLVLYLRPLSPSPVPIQHVVSLYGEPERRTPDSKNPASEELWYWGRIGIVVDKDKQVVVGLAAPLAYFLDGLSSSAETRTRVLVEIRDTSGETYTLTNPKMEYWKETKVRAPGGARIREVVSSGLRCVDKKDPIRWSDLQEVRVEAKTATGPGGGYYILGKVTVRDGQKTSAIWLLPEKVYGATSAGTISILPQKVDRITVLYAEPPEAGKQ